ncbi:cAMP-binding protein [Caenispirillum salinarum AK4]|uniref:cAMP-binding protein n=1 Tax=Caenispirillum salinarum AK4 TaxID=1238182 RepID=K9H070_9PROT|nr:cyclic nucleotide-binding domain-containing protein [Caenispirillum salinarum]EKV30444.1 cAMP-binding protein [Caenispirillum salinarum AK4]
MSTSDTTSSAAPSAAVLAEALAHHPFFHDLPAPALERLAACAREARFDAGTQIFHAGGDADGFFVIRQGTVRVESKRPGSAGPAVLQTLHEGEILGWSWLTPPYRWAFDARAVGPTRVIALGGACLRAAFEADPLLGYRLVTRFAGVMGERLRAAHMRMLELDDGG